MFVNLLSDIWYNCRWRPIIPGSCVILQLEWWLILDGLPAFFFLLLLPTARSPGSTECHGIWEATPFSGSQCLTEENEWWKRWVKVGKTGCWECGCSSVWCLVECTKLKPPQDCSKLALVVRLLNSENRVLLYCWDLGRSSRKNLSHSFDFKSDS